LINPHLLFFPMIHSLSSSFLVKSVSTFVTFFPLLGPPFYLTLPVSQTLYPSVITSLFPRHLCLLPGANRVSGTCSHACVARTPRHPPPLLYANLIFARVVFLRPCPFNDRVPILSRMRRYYVIPWLLFSSPPPPPPSHGSVEPAHVCNFLPSLTPPRPPCFARRVSPARTFRYENLSVNWALKKNMPTHPLLYVPAFWFNLPSCIAF